MSRLLNTPLRACAAVGALWLGLGASMPATAADTAQRVAMASPSHHSALLVARASAEPAARFGKAKAREVAAAKSSRPAGAHSSHHDGSRFQYDSCGCAGS